MDIDLQEQLMQAKQEFTDAVREIKKTPEPSEAQWKAYNAAVRKLAELEREWNVLMHPWGSD